jgi:cytochrome c peroxidase
MVSRPLIAFGLSIVLGAAQPLPDPPRTAEPISPIPPAVPAVTARLTLGAALFNDTRLSGSGQRSCASCHDLKTNGASAKARDSTPDGGLISFNTTTVFNSTFNYRLDWLGHIRTLEEQALASIERPNILHSSMPDVIARLAADPATVTGFQAAYGHKPDGASLLDAIAVFERSLVTPDSPFDRWLDGDTAALSTDALAGYRLFQSVGCVSCHQGRNVGGNLLERAGIFRPVSGNDSPMLRVPSLRNVAVTAPYFSDGGTATLPEAVRIMADMQLGRHLSDVQSAQIVAFLESLTGRFDGRLLTQAR